MQVICLDGTVLQCQRFEAIDSGVLLFEEQRRREAGEDEDEEEEAEVAEEATAFVPLHQLRFVLPENVQPPGVGGQPMGQTTTQSVPQAPPTGGPPPQGQMPPQGSAGGGPSPQQGGSSHPSSQYRPGPR